MAREADRELKLTLGELDERFTDPNAAAEVPRVDPLGERRRLPEVRRVGARALPPQGPEAPPLEVPGLPQAVHGHGRHDLRVESISHFTSGCSPSTCTAPRRRG